MKPERLAVALRATVPSEHDHANLRTRFDHRRFYRGIAFELAAMDY